jgi:hypothetical protein
MFQLNTMNPSPIATENINTHQICIITAFHATPLRMKRLSPPQQRAVNTVEGALLILAGAGSGKTWSSIKYWRDKAGEV